MTMSMAPALDRIIVYEAGPESRGEPRPARMLRRRPPTPERPRRVARIENRRVSEHRGETQRRQ